MARGWTEGHGHTGGGLRAEESEVSAGRVELCPGCTASLSEAPEG